MKLNKIGKVILVIYCILLIFITFINPPTKVSGINDRGYIARNIYSIDFYVWFIYFLTTSVLAGIGIKFLGSTR